MGYLSDNTPTGRNHIVCQDIYPFRVIIDPGFASNLDLQAIIKDEIPNVEEWQFSGRRFCPKARLGKPINPVIHPSRYAQNSRKKRQFDQRVVFAFHTTLQRSQITARLTNDGFKFTIEDEPARPINDSALVIIVP